MARVVNSSKSIAKVDVAMLGYESEGWRVVSQTQNRIRTRWHHLSHFITMPTSYLLWSTFIESIVLL